MLEGDEVTSYFGTIIAYRIVALNDVLFVPIANTGWGTLIRIINNYALLEM